MMHIYLALLSAYGADRDTGISLLNTPLPAGLRCMMVRHGTFETGRIWRTPDPS